MGKRTKETQPSKLSSKPSSSQSPSKAKTAESSKETPRKMSSPKNYGNDSLSTNDDDDASPTSNGTPRNRMRYKSPPSSTLKNQCPTLLKQNESINKDSYKKKRDVLMKELVSKFNDIYDIMTSYHSNPDEKEGLSFQDPSSNIIVCENNEARE